MKKQNPNVKHTPLQNYSMGEPYLKASGERGRRFVRGEVEEEMEAWEELLYFYGPDIKDYLLDKIS